jgi:hypothetical protein
MVNEPNKEYDNDSYKPKPLEIPYSDLSHEEQSQINAIDDILLYFEFKTLMDVHIFDTPLNNAMEHDFSQKDFINVEEEFISIFNRLAGKCKDFTWRCR